MAEQVLIIDDEKPIVESLIAALSLENISARGEVDPTAAIDNFQANPTDVVVVDYRLPGKWTGIDVIAALQAIRPYTQFFLISGWIDENLNEEALSEDLRKILLAKQYFPKPIDSDALVKAIQEALTSVESISGDWKAMAKKYADHSSVTHDQIRGLNEKIKSHLIPALDEERGKNPREES